MIVKMQIYKGYSYKVYIQGSLPKYYYGTNLYGLNKYSIKKAFERLCLELSIPFEKLKYAKVSRLDLGINIEVEHSPKEYINHLDSARYFKNVAHYVNDPKGESLIEVPLPNGLSFINKSRALVIYDKLKELSDKGNRIPNEFSDKNLLRFEYQVQKRVKSKFGESISVQKLWDSKFLVLALEKWKVEYGSIKKVNHLINDLESSNSSGEFFNLCMMVGMETLGGQKGVNSYLEEMKDSGRIDPKKYWYMKQFVGKKYKQFASPHPLIQELDEKVDNISIKNFLG